MINVSVASLIASNLSRSLNVSGYASLSTAKQAELNAWIGISTTITYLAASIDICLILVTWPRRASASRINFLIFHYAIVSFLFNFLSTPTLSFMVLAVSQGYRLPGNICDWTHSTLNILGGVINWCDAGLAVNRCVALLFPHSYRNGTTKVISYFILIFSWLLNFFLYLSVSLGWVDGFLLTPLGFCSIQSKGMAKYFGVFSSYIPYSMVALCALMIFVKNYRMKHARVAETGELNGGTFKRLYTRRLRLTKILLSAIFFSVICMLGSWASMYFTSLFRTNPVGFLWLRLGFFSQFSLPPVRLRFLRPRRIVIQCGYQFECTLKVKHSLMGTRHVKFVCLMFLALILVTWLLRTLVARLVSMCAKRKEETRPRDRFYIRSLT